MTELNPEYEVINDFFDTIYGDEQGYSYIAFKRPDAQGFRQSFFEWPTQKADLIQSVLQERGEFEVYYAPALFTERSAKKEFVKGARCFWVEFDGKIPDSLAGLPEPTLRINSSTFGHEHWYWKTENLIPVQELERGNRALAYLLGADVSGWDAGQILRPPATFNHKRQRQVSLVYKDESVVDPKLFEGLPEPPPTVETPVPDSIPAIEDVVSKFKFPAQVWHLFKNGVGEGQRSDGLMSLGYYLAEMQLNNQELLAMLLNADMRWGKFHERNDQLQRLMEIITRARAKYPLVAVEEEVDFASVGLLSMLTSDIEIQWLWEGFLQESGYGLLTGPSGVGKTQFTLDFAAHLALGKDFLENKTHRKVKVGFFSLEMGYADLKHFLKLQAENYDKATLEALEENLRFFPLGEPIYLNRDEEKQKIEEVIQREGLDGIFIDSLGSTTEGDLSNEKDIKSIIDWNDRLRQKYGIFTWFIHHHRKATSDNKKPNKLADVYGSHYITSRATTVLALWASGIQNSLEVLPLKVRLAPKPEPFMIYRDGKLHFTKKKQTITIVKPKEEEQDETEDKQPVNKKNGLSKSF